MTITKPIRIETISEFHKLRGLPKPEHPLVSVVNMDDITILPSANELSVIFGFYFISMKRVLNATYKYGQNDYDFSEGTLFFMSPNQILGINVEAYTERPLGWVLLIHPDFLWNTSLLKNIKKYEYFDYSVNEALFLSEKEEIILGNIVENIKQEYRSNIDKFSKQIIITHLENLLSYAERFYNRQFITREKTNTQLLNRLDKLLTDYFNNEELTTKGLPTVQYISEALNISPNYLRGLLNVLTGQNTQQHIHNKLIEKAKEKLSTTEFSISEIAYGLGFEHSQSFSKLFKTKTKQSPLEFRQSFN
ncbi:helix-turn-helix domain-containing protein [Spirosoma knui]